VKINSHKKMVVCYICDEHLKPKTSFYQCDKCGVVICENCVEDNLITEGNGTDDISHNCAECVERRKWKK